MNELGYNPKIFVNSLLFFFFWIEEDLQLSKFSIVLIGLAFDVLAYRHINKVVVSTKPQRKNFSLQIIVAAWYVVALYIIFIRISGFPKEIAKEFLSTVTYLMYYVFPIGWRNLESTIKYNPKMEFSSGVFYCSNFVFFLLSLYVVYTSNLKSAADGFRARFSIISSKTGKSLSFYTWGQILFFSISLAIGCFYVCFTSRGIQNVHALGFDPSRVKMPYIIFVISMQAVLFGISNIYIRVASALTRPIENIF